MGLLSKLFGGKSSGTEIGQNYQSYDGFYIICHEYGEAQAKLLFQNAGAGDINAQLTLASVETS